MSWETEVIVGKEQEFPKAMVAVRMATGERVRYVPEHGTLTAEQVCEAIERNFGKVTVLDDGEPVEWRDDWVCTVGINYKAIADELNATLGRGTSSSEAANPQIRCTDSKRNAPVRDREDTHTLLPCPFCGGEAYTLSQAPKGTWYGVGCDDDECRGSIALSWIYNTEAEAISAWNTRAEAVLPQLRKEGHR